jgi:hypothetical protein
MIDHEKNISIPIVIYQAAEKLAEEMGISLSELYTAVLIAYVSKHDKRNITEKLSDIYGIEFSTIEPELIKMQIAVLKHEQW